MEIQVVIFTLEAVIGITVLYKMLPHRSLGGRKPFIAIMPKYKTLVTLPDELLAIEKLSEKLGEYGFSLKSEADGNSKFTRGHILGDISIKLAKVNLNVIKPVGNQSEFTVEAGWVVGFDTGDFWKFLTELKQKIET